MTRQSISVIIPAFNIEGLLPQCLDSILSQDFSPFEVIIVNDGSVDKTGAIANDYAGKDSRVKVITQSNRGLPSARNAGLTKAQGDYIAHVDGDDWLDAGFLSSMYRCASEIQADIVFCDHIRDDGLGRTWAIHNTSWKVYKPRSGREYMLEMALTRASHSSWNKLFKRQLYSDNSILYPPEIVMAEDMVTTYRLAMLANKVVKCPGAYYHYRIRPGSLMETHTFKGRDGYVPIQVMRTFALALPDAGPLVEIVDFNFYYLQFRWIVRNPNRGNQITEKYLVYQDFLNNTKAFMRNEHFKKLPFFDQSLIFAYSKSPLFGSVLNNIWLLLIKIAKQSILLFKTAFKSIRYRPVKVLF